ncbi:MAG: IPT/TIG domain-containing protein, partial [Deltaproteobacteria bacterium]|nr:IPT/TIG domain-containing protein [Deltaproteobacteria bacterium]
MRRFSKYPELILLLLALVFLWGACTEQQENPMLIEDDKPPEISGFSPASQMAGRVVTVQGSYFAPLPDDNHAKVNSTEAEVLSVTREYLTVLVPQGASSGPISVTTRNGTALSEDELTVLGGPSPSISGFLPEKGIIGSSVTITGADFDPVAENNRVLFSGTEAQIIQNSTTSLVVIAPEATSGNIRVSNLAGTAVSRDPFLFILPEDTVNPIIKSYSPISGYAGDTVVIAGLNFDPTPAGNTVKFNDVPAQVTAAAADSLTVVVPDTTSGAISVGTSAGIGHSVLSFEIVPAGGYTVAEGQMGGAVQTGPLGLLGKVSIFAGGGIAAGPINGFGTDTRFDNPIGLASDGTNIYIVDSNNRMIRQLALANVEVTTLAGSGELGSDDGFGFNATFKSVNGIAAEGGFLYVTDLADHKIRKIEIATGIVSTFAGSGSFDTINAVGTAAAFKGPQGITSDGTNLYVVDSAGNTIRRIELATATVTTLAGSGAFGSQDGTGTLASFYRPHGIVAANGYLFVADTSSHKIRKVAISTGEVTTLAGSGLSGSADGTGSEAEFYNPERLATDGTHLYVTDSGNHKIRKVEIATGLVTTVAGAGTPGYEDETGTAATFNYPKGIIVIGPNLYVADSATTIRQIELGTSLVTTIAGDANALNAVNGIGREAKFLKPEGITSDGTNLYIADSYYRLIRKIRISNAKSFTVAGSGFFGSVDATATSASFNYPFGITTDGANLYVSDSQNHK